MSFKIDTSDINGLTKDLLAFVDSVVDEVADQLKEGLYEATPKDTGRAASGWVVVNEGEQVVVQNEVPYITDLDNGHSKQAPAGFVDLEIQKVARQ